MSVLWLISVAASAQQIAITVDDLPEHGPLPAEVTRLQVANAFITALDAAGVPPTYGFVNGSRLLAHPEEAAVLDRWRAAGFPLGNHGWSHMNLDDHTVAAFEADVLRNEPVLSERMAGADWHWLRYPFVAEGDTPEKRSEVRSFLAAHGYKIAAVTMSFGDYLWNEPYARCSAKGDTAAVAQLEAGYLQAAADEAAYERALAKAAFGHDIPYVLLMHIGAFDAHMLPRLLALYRTEGFQFVSLAQAEAAPFYASDLDPSLPAAPDSLAGALALGHGSFPARPPSRAPAPSLCR